MMTSRSIVRVVSLLLCGMGVGCATTFAKDTNRQPAASQHAAYVTGTLILKLKPEAGKTLDVALQSTQAPMRSGLAWLDALNQRYGVTKIEPLFSHQPAPTLQHIYKLTMRNGTDVTRAAAGYERQPDVLYAQPDYLATTQRGDTRLP